MQQARRTLLFISLVITSLSFSGQRFSALAVEPSRASEILQYLREDKVYLLEKIRHQITKPSEKIVVEALLSEDGPKAAKLYRKQLTEYPDPAIDPISRSRLGAYEKAVTSNAAPPAIPSRYASAARPAPLTPPTVQAPAAIAVASRPDSAARKPSAVPATKPAPATKVVAAPATKPLPPATPTPAIRPDAAPRLTTQATAPKAPPVEKPVAAAARPQPQEPAKPVPTSGFTLQFGSFDSVSNANQLASQLSAENAPASVQKINGIYKVRLKNIFATRAEAVAFSRTLPIESFVVTLQP